MTTTPPTDTAAALWSAIDAYGCDAAWHGALGKDATTRAAIDRAITAHVEAEVARRLAGAPDVEAAIDALIDAEDIDTREVIDSERGYIRSEDARTEQTEAAALAARTTLRAAIAADKARAVEAVEDAAFIRGRDAVRKHPEGWGLVARPTPDEARRLVEAFAAAHGALVLLMHGGQYDPFDDEGTRRSAADTARTALLRALGVEA